MAPYKFFMIMKLELNDRDPSPDLGSCIKFVDVIELSVICFILED